MMLTDREGYDADRSLVWIRQWFFRISADIGISTGVRISAGVSL
jgi:hypothetical protein